MLRRSMVARMAVVAARTHTKGNKLAIEHLLLGRRLVKAERSIASAWIAKAIEELLSW